jgi:hypothetical protein
MSEALVIRQEPDAPLPAAQSLEQEVLIRLYGTGDGQEGMMPSSTSAIRISRDNDHAWN